MQVPIQAKILSVPLAITLQTISFLVQKYPQLPKLRTKKTADSTTKCYKSTVIHPVFCFSNSPSVHLHGHLQLKSRISPNPIHLLKYTCMQHIDSGKGL